MRRREFVTLLGGAAAAWPLAARAQQTIRRIGMLLPAAADDAEFQTRVGAFLEGLQQSGWTIGQNVQIDSRWATTNVVEIRRHAAELAALAPDAILASSSPALAALQQATRTVPIVFVNVIDPVGSGFVDSLKRSSGNTQYFLEIINHLARCVDRRPLRERQVDKQLGTVGARKELLLHELHTGESGDEQRNGGADHPVFQMQHSIEHGVERPSKARRLMAVTFHLVGQDENACQRREQHRDEPGSGQMQCRPLRTG